MLGIDIILGKWRHRVVVVLVAFASIATGVITILTFGFLTTNWQLSIHFWGLRWREKVETDAMEEM